MNRQKTLQDYEHACQQAPNEAQREQLALEAMNFLLQTLTVPVEIAQDTNAELGRERDSSGAAPALPEVQGELNDALCAQLEACLADFFPHISCLNQSANPATVLVLFSRAAMICQKVDAWRKYKYWATLFDFLKNASPDQWQQWRSAVAAQQKARAEIGKGDFKRALQFAIYGLRSLDKVPDRRLHLDLGSRIQNAIAEGDACLSVAFALGYWVIKESLLAGHHLRVVGMRHNLGNQLLIAGKNNEAMVVLEEAQKLSDECWSVRDMNYFQINVLERLARAYLNAGETQKSADYLERYGAHASQPREHTLLHLGKGYVALHASNLDKAEQEFEAACRHAEGPVDGVRDDFSNLWSAYVSLALVCLKRDQPVRALEYLDKSCKHGQGKAGYRNADRQIHEILIEAEARHQNSELPKGREKLNEAKELVKNLASPRRQMQLLFAESLLENDAVKRNQALNMAVAHGFYAADPELIKIAVFS